MSTIYIEDQYQLSSKTLTRATSPETIPYRSEVSESTQLALGFAWRWLRGNRHFAQETSGSTGTPKTISLSRERMIISAQTTLNALNLTKKDTALLCLHPKYIGGKMMIVRSLLAEMDLVIVPPSASPLANLPFVPDFTAMVPLQIQNILEAGGANRLNQMKAILIGGAPVSSSLERNINEQLNIPVYSTYGMTETVSHIALRKLTSPGASPFFQVLGDTQIVQDDRGCLKIRGEITGQEWLITNDLVDIKDEKRFRWLGRHDFVINSGGIKVSPEQVEATLEPTLRSLDFRGRYLVSSLPDEKLGERVILLLEGSRLNTPFEENLRKKMASQLPTYHQPKEIHYIPVFAETPTAKVQRQQTLEKFLNQK